MRLVSSGNCVEAPLLADGYALGAHPPHPLPKWRVPKRVIAPSRIAMLCLMSCRPSHVFVDAASGRRPPNGYGSQTLWPTPVFAVHDVDALALNGRLAAQIYGRVSKATGSTGHPPTGKFWKSSGNNFLEDMAAGGGDSDKASRSFRALSDILTVTAQRYLTEALNTSSVAKASSVAQEAHITIKESWAMVSGVGAHQSPHVHARTALSGTYYIECGGPGQEEGLGKEANRGTGKVEGSGRFADHCVVAIEDPRTPAATSDLPDVLRKQLGFGVAQVLHLRPGSVLIHPPWLVHAARGSVGRGPRVTISFNMDVQLRRGGQQTGHSAVSTAVAGTAIEGSLDEL